MTGTAAHGAAIAGATITLVDAAGVTRTATTAADGTFTVDTTGLEPPFMIKLVSGGTTLFTVSAEASADTVMNVTPLTDLILRSWYEVQGVSVDTAFTAPGSNPAPSPTAVVVIGQVVQRIVQLWLDQAGVTGDFNLITTPFAADGTGVDKVLDWTTVDTSTGDITITDGATTQSSAVTYSTTDGSMSVDTTTEGSAGTSTSSTSTVVPVADSQQSALQAIAALADQFAAKVNEKGTGLLGTDLEPYMDPGLHNGGWNRAQYAAVLADHLKGAGLAFQNPSLQSLEADRAVVWFQMAVTSPSGTALQPMKLLFRNVSGVWKMSGDDRVAEVELRAGWTVNQGMNSNSTPIVEVHVAAPQGTVTGVTVTGGPWTDQALNAPVVESTPAGNLEAFEIYDPTTTPAAGSPFDFVVTLSAGGSASYRETSNAVTAEPIAFNEDLHANLGDVVQFNTPISVSWNLPRTFAIAYVRLGRVAYKADNSKCEAEQVLPITATSGSVTIPSICSGAATHHAEIYVQAHGVNGEFTTAYYNLGPVPPP